MASQTINSHSTDFEACVIGIGAQTSVGPTAAATAAAVRARLASFAESGYVDRFGHPIVVAQAPWLDLSHGYVERFCSLACESVKQVFDFKRENHVFAKKRLAIFIGLPEPRPGLPEDMSDRCTKQLLTSIPPEFVVQSVEVYPHGHASGFVALQAALAELTQERADICLVGGVDSYLHPQTLQWIEDCGQLHSENLSWGFIPGEGTGFCLLTLKKKLKQLGFSQPLAICRKIAVAHEENRIKTKTVCIGEGLSKAFQGALEPLVMSEKISYMIGDFNGEPYRADEFGFSVLRTAEAFLDPGATLTPSSSWGDIGAASPFLFVTLAIEAKKRGYSLGANTLIWASSEGGTRGAAFIQCVESREEK